MNTDLILLAVVVAGFVIIAVSAYLHWRKPKAAEVAKPTALLPPEPEPAPAPVAAQMTITDDQVAAVQAVIDAVRATKPQ